MYKTNCGYIVFSLCRIPLAFDFFNEIRLLCIFQDMFDSRIKPKK